MATAATVSDCRNTFEQAGEALSKVAESLDHIEARMRQSSRNGSSTGETTMTDR